jgi:WD40 repeat protein
MASFSGDSKLAAISEKEFVYLVSLATGQIVAQLRAPLLSSFDYRLSFGSTSNQLAAQAADNSIRIWDLDRLYRLLAELKLNW